MHLNLQAFRPENPVSVLTPLKYFSILYHSVLVFLDQFHGVTYCNTVLATWDWNSQMGIK